SVSCSRRRPRNGSRRRDGTPRTRTGKRSLPAARHTARLQMLSDSRSKTTLAAHRLHLRRALAAATLLVAAGCAHHGPGPGKPAPPGPRPGAFVDVAARAGVTFVQSNGQPEKYLFLQTLGGG